MSSTYSPLLRIELIGTGDQPGTWGDTTNTNLGSLIEQAIAGTATVSVTLGNVTLTELNGSADQSRCMALLITGSAGVSRNVVAPASSKIYIVSNTADAAIVLKTSSSTGLTIPAGITQFAYYNGTDFIAASQAYDADLAAIAALSSTGIIVRTGSGTATTRSIAVSGTGLSVTNADGVSGNPTIASNATNANTVSTIVARDASGNFSAGTITAALTGDVTGNVTGNVSGNAGTVTNGVYTSGSYSNPSWITSLATTKLSGAVAVANGGTAATTASGARTSLGLAIGSDIPSPTGTGASGTWNISILGIAAYATNPASGGSFLTSSNYNSYTPTLTGTGASGTWGISISGTAAYATSPASGGSFITSSNIGSQSVTYATSAGSATTATTAATALVCSGNSATATKLSTATGSAPSYSPRAYVIFDGSGTVGSNMTVYTSGNVAGVVKIASGIFVISFSTSLPSAQYAISSSTSLDPSNAGCLVVAPYYDSGSGFFMDTTNVCIKLIKRSDGAATNPTYISVSVIC